MLGHTCFPLLKMLFDTHTVSYPWIETDNFISTIYVVVSSFMNMPNHIYTEKYGINSLKS